MILKEFWLVLNDDQVSVGLSKEERRQVTHNFYLQTRCITKLYENVFCRIKTKDCWRIIVNCCRQEKFEALGTAGGVYEVSIFFPYETFLVSSDIEKKKLALKALMEGINKILNQYEWEREPFVRAYEIVKEKEYQNHWYWKKRVYRADKKFYVAMLCCHEIDTFDIYFILYDRKGKELCRKKILSEIPDDWRYERFLGRLLWKSDTQVWLMHKGGPKAVWAAKFDFENEIEDYEIN